MFDSIQHFLYEPVPAWMFLLIVASLIYRDYLQKKALAMLNEAVTRAIPGIWESR